MGLSERLKKIEQRLSALEQTTATTGKAVTHLVEALEQEDDQAEQPGQTLDGDDAGGERDQTQPL